MDEERILETLSLKYEFELALRIEKEFTKQTLIVQLTNLLKIGVCAGIAIYFQHWWIILISLFLQQTVKRVPMDFSNEGDTEDENK